MAEAAPPERSNICKCTDGRTLRPKQVKKAESKFYGQWFYSCDACNYWCLSSNVDSPQQSAGQRSSFFDRKRKEPEPETTSLLERQEKLLERMNAICARLEAAQGGNNI